ncbi:MAG: YdgA family protein [Neisseria sp.]|nr:YdgA family protein [Neisseria sp.]
MSKKLLSVIGAVLVVLLAYVALAWYCGKGYQQQAQQDMEKINGLFAQALSDRGLPDAQLKVRQTEFKRGIFSSEARYVMTGANEEEGIPVVAKIQHGPFVGARLARYQAVYDLENVPSTNLLFKLTEGKSPLTVKMRESFTNAVAIEASMPPINLTKDGEQTVFSGLTIKADSDRDMSFFKGKLNMDSFALTSGYHQLKVTGWDADFDLKSSGNYFTGDSNSTVKSINYNGLMEIILDTIKLNSDSKDVAALNNSKMTLNIASLNVNKQDFGSLQWDTKVDNLDMNVYQKIADDVRQYSALSWAEEERRSAMQRNIADNVRTLLAAKPVLTIDPLAWKTPAGTSTASLTVNFKAPAGEIDFNRIPDWQEVVEAIVYKSDLSKSMLLDVNSKVMQIGGMDAETAKGEAQRLIEQYTRPNIENGIMVESANSYTTDIRYQAGMINVNGKNMSVEEFIMLGQKPTAEELAASEAAAMADETAADTVSPEAFEAVQ